MSKVYCALSSECLTTSTKLRPRSAGSTTAKPSGDAKVPGYMKSFDHGGSTTRNGSDSTRKRSLLGCQFPSSQTPRKPPSRDRPARPLSDGRNASTARLRSPLWHDDETDTGVKLGEPETMPTFTLPSPSTARRRSRSGSEARDDDRSWLHGATVLGARPRPRPRTSKLATMTARASRDRCSRACA